MAKDAGTKIDQPSDQEGAKGGPGKLGMEAGQAAEELGQQQQGGTPSADTGRSGAAAEEAAELARDGRRLRRGLVLTFTAVALLALGTASGWWPQPEGEESGEALVSVRATSGERLCGSLGEAGPGTLTVTVDGSPVVVSLGDVAALAPVESC